MQLGSTGCFTEQNRRGKASYTHIPNKEKLQKANPLMHLLRLQNKPPPQRKKQKDWLIGVKPSALRTAIFRRDYDSLCKILIRVSHQELLSAHGFCILQKKKTSHILRTYTYLCVIKHVSWTLANEAKTYKRAIAGPKKVLACLVMGGMTTLTPRSWFQPKYSIYTHFLLHINIYSRCGGHFASWITAS